MQKNSKVGVVIPATILVISFFMPWINFFISINAWDVIFHSQFIDSIFKYLVLLIPISGIMIVYGTVFNKENYLISKDILFKLPVLILCGIALTIVIEIGTSKRGFRNSDFVNFLKIFGIGFWVTVIASIVLFFLQPRTNQNKYFKQ